MTLIWLKLMQFQRFDEDHSGESGEWEFTQAWPFLGLKGSQGGKAFL
jgi:hypothetical protein